MSGMNQSGVILSGEEHKYFLLNIIENMDKKRGNNVDFWMGKKFAPIFYDNWTMEQIENKQTKLTIPPGNEALTTRQENEANRFVKMFQTIKDENILFSIGNKDIYFFRQCGLLKQNTHNNKEFGVKGFEIDIIKIEQIKKCPLILASTKANRNLSARTFIQLDEKLHLGNIKAIKYILQNERASPGNFTDYLKCLSSVEFETLIAKIFEEKGFFVPAYKGGFIKNFDLVCRNSTEELKKIGGKEILPRCRISIQIKTKLTEKDYNDTKKCVDFYFCIESKVKEKPKIVFAAQDIKEFLDKSKTMDWLEETLDWADNPPPSPIETAPT